MKPKAGFLAMKPADPPRADKATIRSWWWFDPNRHEHRGEAAFTWEIIRRSKLYPALWQEDREARSSIAALSCDPTGSWSKDGFLNDPHMRYAHGLLWQIVGPELTDLLNADCDPLKHWLELTPKQRAAFTGPCPFQHDARHILPRQGPPESLARMIIRIAETKRGDDNKLHAAQNDLWLQHCFRSHELQKIPISRCAVFVAVLFDTRLTAEALERQFDNYFARFLELSVRQPLTDADFRRVLPTRQWPPSDPSLVRARERFRQLVTEGNWDEIARVESFYPSRWQPDRSDGKPRQRRIDPLVRVVPLPDFPHAVCFIPAACDIATVRSRFHNAVRLENRSKWYPACKECWRHENPRAWPKLNFAKRWTIKDVALGLAAFDANLKQNSPTRDFLIRIWLEADPRIGQGQTLAHHSKVKKALVALWNLRRAIARRVHVLDKSPYLQMVNLLSAARRAPQFPFLPVEA